jgi:hypothetical protein
MNTPVKCVKCDARATWVVNESPHCAYHAASWAQWCLYHEGAVSKWYNELGFVRTLNGEYIPVKEDERDD